MKFIITTEKVANQDSIVEIAEEGRMRFSQHNIETITIVEHQIDFNVLTKIQKPHGPIEHITYTVTRDH